MRRGNSEMSGEASSKPFPQPNRKLVVPGDRHGFIISFAQTASPGPPRVWACGRGVVLRQIRHVFFRCRFRSRTPGPLPFSSMNSTPAASPVSPNCGPTCFASVFSRPSQNQTPVIRNFRQAHEEAILLAARRSNDAGGLWGRNKAVQYCCRRTDPAWPFQVRCRAF